MEFITLNNGVQMPKVGYGVYLVPPEECERCVLDALDVGYRSIDTAQQYENEEGVGTAISKCGIPREELFLTSKIWISESGEEKAMKSIDETLRKMKTDYLDLMLIHQAFGDYYGTWRAMEKAYKAGKLRAIGVSNFFPDRLIDLHHFSEIKPMVNQIETHIIHQRKIDHEYMVKYGCVHEAWAPLGEGKNGLLQNPVICAIGQKYGKTAAQTILRFLVQSDVVVIPKSSRKERMAENINIFDFALTEEEMNAIRALDQQQTVFFKHYDPEIVEMFMTLA